MLQIGPSLNCAIERMQSSGKDDRDFPSPHHKIAFEIAMYSGEQYSFWVRKCKTTWLLVGQIEYEFRNLKAKPSLTKRQKIKMLMATMFPQG